jgi:dTDP-4-dehydrorhamnose reductase
VLRLLPGDGFVVRTAWLYGAHGPNFVRTMIRLASERRPVTVVADQHGQPTWAADVARKIIELAGSRAPPGVYHATSSGETTWHGLAREVFRLSGADPALVSPVPSDSCPRPAHRPRYSVLGHRAWAAAGIEPIGDWRQSLHRAFPALAARPFQ